MNVPIRVRMTVWYVALVGVVVAAVGAFLVLRLRADLVAGLDGRLGPAVVQIARGYHAEGPPEAPDVSGTVLSGRAAASQVLTPAGRVVVSYGAPVARRPMLRPADLRSVAAGGSVTRTAVLGPSRERFRVHAGATTRGAYRRAVVAAEPMAAIDGSVHRLLVLLLLAGPTALLATAAGGWWLAGRSLRPIGRLTARAGGIGMDRLAERLPVPATGDEVARLAATLNAMLARIQRGVDDQQRLIADASHELRTPLAAMRAELDVSLRADELDAAARDVLLSTRDEVDRLARTVDGLLTLARADRRSLTLARAPLDLAGVAAETVERLVPIARERDVALTTRLAPAPAAGDAGWLGRAVANLLDNAIAVSPPGATVAVTTARAGDEVRLTVCDEGPGIPPDARERVFDRFYRLDGSRARATGGAGIGLSIVREIAHGHGGRVWAEPAATGGSRFVLVLPARASGSAVPNAGERVAVADG